MSFGLALGWLTARQLAGSIEKKGEYRTTWKNWAVIALASILVVWAVFLTGIPFGILRIILSAVMWAPFAMYLGRLLYFSRWEKQKGKTIYFEGYFTTRFFATPRISPSMAWKDVPLERSR